MPPVYMRKLLMAFAPATLSPIGSDWRMPLMPSAVTFIFLHLASIGHRLTKTSPSKACSAITDILPNDYIVNEIRLLSI